MHSSPRKFRGPAWDCPSAVPSLNLMVAGCGLPTTLRGAQVFALLYLPKSRHTKTPAADPTVLVIDDDGVVRSRSAEGKVDLLGRSKFSVCKAQCTRHVSRLQSPWLGEGRSRSGAIEREPRLCRGQAAVHVFDVFHALIVEPVFERLHAMFAVDGDSVLPGSA